MSRLSARRSSATHDQSFPKSVRLLRPAEFRNVYDNGWRYTCPAFAAFCLRTEADRSARFGFTLPRAIGKAHDRNRLKRRIREIVRRMKAAFPNGLDIVFNPRRTAFQLSAEEIRAEIERLAARCRR